MVGCKTEPEKQRPERPNAETKGAIQEKPEDPSDLKVTNNMLDKAKPVKGGVDFPVFDTYTKLEKEASLIVEGYFSENATQEVNFCLDKDNKTNENKSGMSTNKFTVTKVFKGNKDIKSVDVSMYYYLAKKGGEFQLYSWTEMKPMKKGEHWVLFLNGGGFGYTVCGDYSGRFAIPTQEQISDAIKNKKTRGMGSLSFGMDENVKPFEPVYRELIKKFYKK